jgi:SHS2 domain-containing protein
MRASFELFDHTADLGVRVRAPTMPGLAATAIEALYATIGTISTTGESATCRLEFSGDEPVLMLRDLLAELLVEFESGHRRLVRPRVKAFDATRLAVSGDWLSVDYGNCEFRREVKAITYHDLALRAIAGGHEFVFIVDI